VAQQAQELLLRVFFQSKLENRSAGYATKSFDWWCHDEEVTPSENAAKRQV
jgi:hypothetical protein